MHRTPRARATQIAAVIVALLTVRLVAGDLSALHRGARVFGATRPVVVARADLDLGSRVRRADLRVVKLPAAAIPAGTLARLDDAVERVVAVPVLAGASVSERALAPRRRDGLAGIVAPGRRAVRVTTADGLRPETGSVVDIIATLDSREVGGTLEPSAVVARAARVISVDAPPSSSREASSTDTGGRVGVVVLVTVAEASHLADATARGVLMLALDPPEEACLGDVPVACAP
jgi:Flp pilus assembly protein CpaB